MNTVTCPQCKTVCVTCSAIDTVYCPVCCAVIPPQTETFPEGQD